MSRLPTIPPRSRRRAPRPARRDLRAADPANPGRTDTRPAGVVLVVMVAALLVGAVFNAQALLADARGKPLGAGRTVSVAIWTPVARVAAALSLDRPRRAAESALGRVDDTPTVTVTVPPAGAGPVGAAPGTARPGSDGVARSSGPPPLPAATPQDKLSVLLVGDSSMTAVGGALTRQLAATGVADTELDARPSTGFSRPDFFDWPTRLAQLTSGNAPDLVIAMFGANDAQGFEHDGEVHDFGTESWTRTYRARVATAMDLLVAQGHRVIWIGQPVMRSSSFDQRMTLIDEIVRTEAATRPAVRYVDASEALAGPDGGYAEYVADRDGTQVRIRDGDGIHLTTAGADRLAELVLAPVRREVSAGDASAAPPPDGP